MSSEERFKMDAWEDVDARRTAGSMALCMKIFVVCTKKRASALVD